MSGVVERLGYCCNPAGAGASAKRKREEKAKSPKLGCSLDCAVCQVAIHRLRLATVGLHSCTAQHSAVCVWPERAREARRKRTSFSLHPQHPQATKALALSPHRARVPSASTLPVVPEKERRAKEREETDTQTPHTPKRWNQTSVAAHCQPKSSGLGSLNCAALTPESVSARPLPLCAHANPSPSSGAAQHLGTDTPSSSFLVPQFPVSISSSFVSFSLSLSSSHTSLRPVRLVFSSRLQHRLDCIGKFLASSFDRPALRTRLQRANPSTMATQTTCIPSTTASQDDVQLLDPLRAARCSCLDGRDVLLWIRLRCILAHHFVDAKWSFLLWAS